MVDELQQPVWRTVLNRQDVQTVWSASEFVQLQMQRHPDRVLALYEQGLLNRPRQPGELADAMRSELAACQDEPALSSTLRRFRNREMVRIIWRDLLNLADLAETLEALSELADQCVQQGLAKLYHWASAKSGVPRDGEGREQQLVVLGMGKLGARELNLSSDIDLIFCYPSHGQTDGKRPLDNETFFTRLGRQLIQLLGKQTAEGFVFRVDMRLRPFGDSGPLVVSFGAMENYFYGQAREWERYAMVKARALTGQPDDIKLLDQMRKAFVFRRYIDFGVIESIRSMKRMIERELKSKGIDDNIKLGLGGIREIEFIGQALQLVRGGRDIDLQIRPIQPVLALLGKKALLPNDAARELLQAYVFLRLTENRIQAWRDEQLHLLPQDEAGRERIAHSMGFSNWETFYPVLQQHRQQVHAQFEQVFEAPQAEPKEASMLSTVWLSEDEPEQQIAHLAESFSQADVVWQCLDDLRSSAAVRTLSANARNKLDHLMSSVLDALAGQKQADMTLQRVVRLLEGIVRRTAYLDLLNENPLALSQLLRLLRESVWVGSQLVRQPILLDELLDPRRLYSPLHHAELQAELETLLASVDEGDLEQEMERLRQFAQGNRLRVAAADITGAVPLMVVSDYLTGIAEISLQQAQQSAWRDMTAKYGSPVLPNKMETGFAVIGYGKLGGIELGYGSDLDLVFLHGSDQASAMTNGERSVANDVFYARLGQRMVHILNTRTPSGQLYEVDMRLRPNGQSGMLVSSLKAFAQYQHNNAWTWEHQALLRARAVCGDPILIEQFNAVRREVLCQVRDAGQLRQDVREMRAKMAGSLDRSNDEVFDIKQGSGGLVDIEFMVQFAVLRWAHEYPDLVDWTDNARLLERLTEYQLLEGDSAEQLFAAYRVLRAISHRKALQEEKSLIAQGQLLEERAMVSEIWQQLMVGEPG
jgi:glutamate-ammonia-ligase adenylyltransferase